MAHHPSTISDEVVDRVHFDAYPIDLHLDSLSLSLAAGFDFEKGDWIARKSLFLLWFLRRFTPKGQNAPINGHVAGPDLLQGGYGGGCVVAHALLGNLVNLPFSDPWNCWLDHKAYVERLVDESKGKYRITRTPQEVLRAQNDGAISFIFCVEGAHVLGRFGVRRQAIRVSRLRALGQAGAAYLTLNHYCNTDISQAGYWPLNGWRKTPRGGLSRFGRRVVQTCIEEGILLDLTHTSTQGIKDVCDQCIVQNVPVLVSHGASRTVTKADHVGAPYELERTLSDDAIEKVIQTGGSISVILAPYFLQIGQNPDGSRKMDADLAFVVSYYERMAQQIAAHGLVNDPWKHLTFGSDFDGGIPSIPIGMTRGADLPELTRAMLEAGWPTSRIKDVYSRNFLRIWSAVRSRSKRNEIAT